MEASIPCFADARAAYGSEGECEDAAASLLQLRKFSVQGVSDAFRSVAKEEPFAEAHETPNPAVSHPEACFNS